MFCPTTESSKSLVRPPRFVRLKSLVTASALGVMASLVPVASASAESGSGSSGSSGSNSGSSGSGSGTSGLVQAPVTSVTAEAATGSEVVVDQSAAVVEEATGTVVEVEQTAATTLSCQEPLIVNPFTAFGDFRDYVLAPYGDFENAALPGWTLTGGASVVRTSSGNGTLRLPEGSTATSPAMCIDLNYPTMRYFVRDADADQARLRTQVMYVDHATAYTPYTVGKLTAKSTWRLTEDIEVLPERGGVDPGWRRVAFRLLPPANEGDIRIDDFYIDPRMR
jgi:hypothetical protein